MVKITWRDEDGGYEELAPRVARMGGIAVLSWESRTPFAHLLGTHKKRTTTALCTVESSGGTLSPADKAAIENMARLRYAEFFEEDGCG